MFCLGARQYLAAIVLRGVRCAESLSDCARNSHAWQATFYAHTLDGVKVIYSRHPPQLSSSTQALRRSQGRGARSCAQTAFAKLDGIVGERSYIRPVRRARAFPRYSAAAAHCWKVCFLGAEGCTPG